MFPTLTDAAVVLGFLNPESLAGGTQLIDHDAAVNAIRTYVAEPLHLGLLEAAYGIYTITIANMTGVIRAVSSERGRDPRDFMLMAFGGAGPLHGVEIARSFEIPKVIVPISPGLFSTIGLLVADIQHHSIRSNTKRSEIDAEAIDAAFQEMETHIQQELGERSHKYEQVIFERFVDMRYAGQSFELRIPVLSDASNHLDIGQLRSQFGHEYERTYGHQTPDQQTEIVNLRLRTTCLTPETRSVEVFTERKAFAEESIQITRDAYFGPVVGVLTTPVLSRWQLNSEPMPGPLLIEDMDATTLVPPHSHAYRDALGNIIIEVG
jgi:N-methylhydantoinase A